MNEKIINSDNGVPVKKRHFKMVIEVPERDPEDEVRKYYEMILSEEPEERYRKEKEKILKYLREERKMDEGLIRFLFEKSPVDSPCLTPKQAAGKALTKLINERLKNK